MSANSMTPLQLKELIAAGKQVELIDVRTPVEFRERHVAFAKNVPLDQLDPEQIKKSRTNGEALYVICRTGGRGQKACAKLSGAGLANVVNIEGGTLACEEAGLPIVRGPKGIALERQVRIAAGSLVLLGALLAWFVHPYFLALAAFIGAGLVFAGVTDTCGMGLLLARMPWNRAPAAACTVEPKQAA